MDWGVTGSGAPGRLRLGGPGADCRTIPPGGPRRSRRPRSRRRWSPVAMLAPLFATALALGLLLAVPGPAGAGRTAGGEAAYKAACSLQPRYRDLVRDATARRGHCVTEKAQVFQYNKVTGRHRMLVDVTDTGNGIWNTAVEVELPPTVGGRPLLQADIVRVWGVLDGTTRTRTQFGDSIVVPVVQARYVALLDSTATSTTTQLTT